MAIDIDPDEADRDKITSLRVGFAYDRTTIRRSKVRRFACAFLCDLADLTPEHPAAMAHLRDAANVRCRTASGVVGDADGPLARWDRAVPGITEEIKAINSLFDLAYGVPLFRTEQPSGEWGCVLRSTTTEWGQFILATDKLLSDNLNKKALDETGVPDKNDDVTNAGTLTRLGFYLRDVARVKPELIEQILDPLKDVRKQRQKPAHQLAVASTDATLAAQQRDVLAAVGGALHLLREVMQCHPAARNWPRPDYLDDKTYVV